MNCMHSSEVRNSANWKLERLSAPWVQYAMHHLGLVLSVYFFSDKIETYTYTKKSILQMYTRTDEILLKIFDTRFNFFLLLSSLIE